MASPSLLHEGLVELFRNRPELAAEVLRDVLGVPVPAYSEARVESGTVTSLDPAELRADLVVLLRAGGDEIAMAIVVEVQLSLKKDDRKLFAWPAYIANLRARFRVPACVLVVTPYAEVAERARAPIALGPGSVVYPIVLGPEAVPIVTDREEARRAPELAVLSAMAHGRDRVETAVAIATAAVAAADELEDARALLYLDLIRIALSGAARHAFEELMAHGNYQYQSDFAKKYFSAGKAEGRAEGKAESVLQVLEARSVALSAEQRALIVSCTDIATLDAWFRKALVLGSAEDLFK